MDKAKLAALLAMKDKMNGVPNPMATQGISIPNIPNLIPAPPAPRPERFARIRNLVRPIRL